MKTILLTGTSGVVGRLLATKLINDFKIIAVGSDYRRIPEALRHHKNLKFYERDLLQMETVDDISISEPIDVILHLAGVVSGSKLTESDYFKINAESTKLLLKFAMEKNSKAFGLASSVSVYGTHDSEISVSSDRRGKSVYARSKMAAEDFCETSNVPTSIFRIASVYGNGTKSFISKLSSMLRKGFYPSLRQERKKSIIHIEDLVTALESWTRRVIAGKPTLPVYVLSHPEAVTISEVIQVFRSQKSERFPAIGIPIFRILIPVFHFLYHFFRKIRKVPTHDSPLDPLLFSVEIYDEMSWKDLDVTAKWDLRKGISQYQ